MPPSFKVSSEHIPVLRDEDREMHDIPKLKHDIFELKKHVMEQARANAPVMTEQEASQYVPYLYNTSDMLVRKILNAEQNVDSLVRLLLHLLEHRQSGGITGDQADKTFGLEMARLYFPESALQDIQSSGKADRALGAELS